MKIPNNYKRLESCSKEELIEKIIVRDKHCNDLKKLLDKGLKKYKELEEENKELKERIRFLEQCLDNKEKVNKSLREELQRYKDMWDSGEF